MPKLLRRVAFLQLHDTLTSGHLGINKTIDRLRQTFYWSGLQEDAKRWCSACDMCASRQGSPRMPRAPLSKYTVGAPAERIAADIMGPLPTTESGHKYILLVVDYFTKWPEAFPLPNQEAATVAEVLVKEYVCRYGVPLSLHSDQGRNLESHLIQEKCSILGISKTRTTPLHPQSDGLVERMNCTLEPQLSLLLSRPEQHLPVHSYNEKLQKTLETVHEYARARCSYLQN